MTLDAQEFETMFRVEDHHWWFRGMTGLSFGLLADWLEERGDVLALDAGCGTGGFLTQLSRGARAVGVDVSARAMAYCRRRQLTNLAQASVQQLPFGNQCFDLVTSFDVLSLCDELDVQRALREFRRVLRPGGRLLLRLPAYQWMTGRHDEAVGTQRRYSKAVLRLLLQEHGFDLCRLTYANAVLLPLIAAKRITGRWLLRGPARSDLGAPNRLTNAVFGAALRCEQACLRRFGLPFGVTVLALAEPRTEPPVR